MTGLTLLDEQNPQIDALDVLIEQERQLITHYEARAARAEATATAAITAVLALAALTAAATETSDAVEETSAWFVAGALAMVCISALAVRTFAGLRRSRTALLSTRSDRAHCALKALRECHDSNLDPVEVRRRTLHLCVARTEDAHETAKAKDRVAALASAALGVALIAVVVLRLQAA
jgi:hypothetical protein